MPLPVPRPERDEVEEKLFKWEEMEERERRAEARIHGQSAEVVLERDGEVEKMRKRARQGKKGKQVEG